MQPCEDTLFNLNLILITQSLVLLLADVFKYLSDSI